MPRPATPHSSPSSSTQAAEAFSHSSPLLVPKPKSRNIPVSLRPGWRHNKPLPTLPEEAQQDEVYSVEIVNHLNRDDDGIVPTTCPSPERRVEWMANQEMAEGEQAMIERAMGDFQPPYLMCSSATFSEYEEGATSHQDQAGHPSRSFSHDLMSPLDKLGSTDETDCHDSTSSWTESNEPCPSLATWSTARSSTIRQSSILSYISQHECPSPPRPSCLEHTPLSDQSYTLPQNQGPEWIPSSDEPYGTVAPPPRIVITDDQTERHVAPLATTPTSASPTRRSSRHSKPKFSIDIELAGYKPGSGPSPLLADQATAHHVYRAIRLHESTRLKAHPDWRNQPEYLRIKKRQKESRLEDKLREKLAAPNAEAAQGLRAVEQASGIGPGKGRKLVPKREYDNSAWQALPNGGCPTQTRPAPRTDDQPTVAEVVQPRPRRGGRRSDPSSVESVCASSTRPRSQAPKPAPILLPSRTPSPPGNESASSSGSSSESENSFGALRTPTMFEHRDLTSFWVRSNGSPSRPLVPQPSIIDDQWENLSEKLPAGLTSPTPVLKRSKRLL